MLYVEGVGVNPDFGICCGGGMVMVVGMERGRGIVIRLTKLTDTSLIVHWMTEGAGLMKTVARGARRMGSGFAGRLDLFVEAEIVWVRSRSGELHQLREVSVVDHREGLRGSYRETLLASYFGQLLEKVLEPDHGEDELFDLLRRGLDFLVREGASLRGMRHFEKEVARMLGLGGGGAIAIEGTYGNLPRSRESCLDLLAKK